MTKGGREVLAKMRVDEWERKRLEPLTEEDLQVAWGLPIEALREAIRARSIVRSKSGK